MPAKQATKGILNMELTIISIVFAPLILTALSLSGRWEKAQRIILIVSGIFYFAASVVLFLHPGDLSGFNLPQILWKFILLLSVLFLFLHSIKDKRYGISVIHIIQAVILIVMEIALSPEETIPFLQLQSEGKLLFLTGAFISACFLPVIVQYLKQYYRTMCESRRKYFYPGAFLLLASFAGLMTANSMIGLFLFWQWGYFANHLLIKAFGMKSTGKWRVTPVIQQAVLTAWLIGLVLVHIHNGPVKLMNFTGVGQANGVAAGVLFLTVIVMGSLIPERAVIKSGFPFPIPVTGWTMTLFSLIIPLSIFLKFRPFLFYLDSRILSLIVFFGSLLMAANAFYAGLSRHGGRIISYMVLYTYGWGTVTAFSNLEHGLYPTGYIAVAALLLAFLFIMMMHLEAFKGIRNVEQMGDPAGQMPGMTIGISIALVLFIVAPFVFLIRYPVMLKFMAEYALSVLFVVTGLVLMASVVFRWLSNVVTGRKKAGAFCDYSLFAWMPRGNHSALWVRISWIITLSLFLGVALSCFR